MKSPLARVALACAVTWGGALGCNALLSLPEGHFRAEEEASEAALGDGGGDEVAPTFCSTVSPTPRVCSDFDDPGPYSRGWDNDGQIPDPGVMGTGTFAVDEKLAYSAPRSLAASVTNVTSSGAAFLLRSIAVPTRLDMDLRINIGQADFAAGGSVAIYSVVMGDNGIVVSVNERGAVLAVEPSPVAIRFDPPLAFGSWQRVFVRVDNVPLGPDAGSDGQVQVFVEDVIVATALLPARFRKKIPAVQVTVGVQAAGPVKAFRANFDNVYGRWD